MMEFKLVILLLSSLPAADVQTLKGCSVTAEVGETAILPVKVDLPEYSELLYPIIKWKTETGDTVHQYVLNHDYDEYQLRCFKYRTSLFKEKIIRGNVSLKITKVTKRDVGKYTCEVLHEDPDIKKAYEVSLCVKEEGEVFKPESPKPKPGKHWYDYAGQVLLIVFGIWAISAAVLLRICRPISCLDVIINL